MSKTMRRTDRKIRRVWNTAIGSVRNTLAELSDHIPLSEDNQRLLRAVFNICDQLSYDEELLSRKTNEELAQKYGCSVRTITNWRKEGAPLDEGQWKMLDWLAWDRRYVPKKTGEKFASQLKYRKWRGMVDQMDTGLAQLKKLDRMTKGSSS